MDSEVTPMFPLGSVLFPGAVLPLHVFEDRYRTLVDHCLEQDSTFGVVLIERGSEVGGGDVRFSVGTLATIVRAGRFDNGRLALVTVGTRRFRVREWLADDPYPRATVTVLDDPARADAAERVAEVGDLLRRALALHAELGAPVADDAVTLSADPVRASFEASAAAPIGPLDAQALLEVDDAGVRLDLLATCLAEEISVLEFRRSGA